MTLPRWWYILRYHRFSQLGWRVASVLHRQVFPFLSHGRHTDIDPAALVRREHTGFASILSRHLRLRSGHGVDSAHRLLRGEFEFLNERRELSLPIDWQLKSVEPVSHLWRFHLHYHEFLLDLLTFADADEQQAALERIWEIIADWIDANPIDQSGALSDAWHPFCLSKRIAVWLLIWQEHDPPAMLRDRFVRSLESQIRYLERHLEWDLRGNHLLENLRTLALAGAYFEGRTSDRRLEVAGRFIQEQLAEQILPTGEHFERSPMYHAQMLSAVLDMRDAFKRLRPELAETCQLAAIRMANFMADILHPDGQIPLLSDSALDETPSVAVLLADVHDGVDDRVANDSSNVSEARDYWTWKDEGDFVLLDAGPVGADELPAHAHCDLLTLEASIDGRRLFVDSGVYDYGDGEMRKYCRSTAAHNVLQIDRIEQCDMWSRFRLGYRGHPSPLEQGQTGSFMWCRATHNAYRRIGVPVVGRWLACRPGPVWFCVDWAEGTGLHDLTTRLHLSPDVSVTLESPQQARLNIGEHLLILESLTTAEMTIEDGWYCPNFGVRERSSVLKFTTRTQLPGFVGWVLRDVANRGSASLQIHQPKACDVLWTEGEEVTSFIVTAAPDGKVR
ncbi:MAG: alginate lyase family protein [Planctomycetaceae bacterium]